MASLLFNFFALLTILSAVGVVVNKNAVNGAMCLLLSLVGVAGLFMQLDAYLLAFLLLLVYAGAVVALFLFIVMLLDVQGRQEGGYRGLSTVASLLSLALLLAGLASSAMRTHIDTAHPNDIPAVGTSLKLYAQQLFTTYLLPVQVMGFLLLIAMIGVIVLSKRHAVSEDAK